MRKKLMNSVREFLSKLNWLYIAIIVMIVIGIAILVSSHWIVSADSKNICVGLGTGIVTSALVSLYIDAINRKVEKNKLSKYKNMLLNPLYNAVRSLYIHVILNLNEYRVREKVSGYLFLPMEKTEELSNFLNELKAYDLNSVDETKGKDLMICFVFQKCIIGN